jgi:hypothetical protein
MSGRDAAGVLPPRIPASLPEGVPPDGLPDTVMKLVHGDPNRRFVATHFYELPEDCEQAACRRARRCLIGDAPCLDRYGCYYDDVLGELYAALNGPPAEPTGKR